MPRIQRAGTYSPNWSHWPLVQGAALEETAKQVKEADLGPGSQDEAVSTEAKSTQEEQRQEVVGDCRHDLHGQPQRPAVPSGEIIDDSGKKHIEQTAANLLAAVAASRAGETHLGDHLAAKRALVQIHGHSLAAE